MIALSARVAPEKAVTPTALLTPIFGEMMEGDIMSTKRLTTEEFIRRSVERHGDRYDYSRSVYRNSRTDIEIVCRKHGSFLQRPKNHYLGYHCPLCGNESKRLSQSEFVSRCQAQHGDRYDYGKVVYDGPDSEIIVTCKPHGDFNIVARVHLNNARGCPVCADERRVTSQRFLKRCHAIFGDAYTYDAVTFETVSDVVTVTCKKHGDFSRAVSHLLEGRGCPQCARERVVAKPRKTPSYDVVERFVSVHGDRYDYSLVNFVAYDVPVDVICRKHGVFPILPINHWKGAHCRKCARETAGEKNRLGDSEWLEKFRAVHGDRYDYPSVQRIHSEKRIDVVCKEHGVFSVLVRNHYYGKHGCPDCSDYGPDSQQSVLRKFLRIHGDRYDYSEVDYRGTKDKVTIICKSHGRFLQAPDSHIQGAGCPKCGIESRLALPSRSVSKAELEIQQYVNSLGFDTEHGYLPQSDSKWTFDVILPDQKLAIEYNGVYWHSYPRAHRGQHYHKRKNAEANGYRLITIWEDNWQQNRARMESLIRRALRPAEVKLGARETLVAKVPLEQAKEFHEAYHVQGFGLKRAAHHYALFDQADMVAVASFDSVGTLHRYTVMDGVSIAGGLKKLIKAYRGHFGDLPIVTFCDRDHFTGCLYRASGFDLTGGSLTMSYVVGPKRVRREHYMKHKLPALFEDVDMSMKEIDICAENNVFACWNSGTERYILQ